MFSRRIWTRTSSPRWCETSAPWARVTSPTKRFSRTCGCRSTDLPVVLAARMSLAFPILLTAVKLGAIDFSKAARADTPKLLPEPCWFADGGLSSNFPIHLFDSPLPRWPTFAVISGRFCPTRATIIRATNLETSGCRNRTAAESSPLDLASRVCRHTSAPVSAIES